MGAIHRDTEAWTCFRTVPASSGGLEHGDALMRTYQTLIYLSKMISLEMGDVEEEIDALEDRLVDTSAEPIKLSYATIRSITNNFSEDEVIGRGGFGVVYLGSLSEDKKVAVKKLLSSSPDFNDEQFAKEVKCLTRVKHKNIVLFLGYCADTRGEVMDLEGKHVLVEVQRERSLCFEYAPNGSLDKYKENFHEMDWTIRYRIIKGICQGLDYLHDQHINHLDLKPENVLLNILMEPKITDFGLSRCFDDEQTRVKTKNVYGTLGYIAPEFVDGGEISYKSDIYSLGVIISKLSMGCSMPSTDDLNMSNEHWQHMKKCAELAQSCIDTDQHKRPTIKEILCKLYEIESQIEKVIPVYETSIDQINPRREPLHVHPRKLIWPLAANRSMPFSLHLTNNSTNNHVAFMFLDSGTVVSSKLLRRRGVIPPQSTWGIVIHLQLQGAEQAIPEQQGKDMVLVRSTIVRKGFVDADITIDMFKGQTTCVDDIELEVVFVEPPQPQPLQLSEFDHMLQLDGNEGTQWPTTKTCPGFIRTELLDIYPLELRYPRKPEKFCIRTIHLTNTTDDSVSFWMSPSATARYFPTQKVPGGCNGIIPPKSTWAVPWTLMNEIYQPINTESFEILMVTTRNLGFISKVDGYPVDLAEQMFNGTRQNGGKMHRACLFVDNNSGLEKANHSLLISGISTLNFGKITSMDVHPTEPLVLTGHQKFLCIWRITKGRLHVPENAQGFMDDMKFVVKFIARMQWVLSGDGSGKVNAYTTKFKLLHTFTAHSGRVRSFAVHPSRPYVLSSSDDLLIKLWDWDNAWTCTREFRGHLNPVTQVTFNPNNTNSFASVSRLSSKGPGNVKLWSINSTNPETRDEGRVTHEPVNRSFFCGFCRNPWKSDMFMDSRTTHVVSVPEVDLYGGFKAIDWSAPIKDGQYLVAAVEDGYIEIWDMNTERCVHAIKNNVPPSEIQAVACHPTLPIVATGFRDRLPFIVNLNTYRMVYHLQKIQSEKIVFGFNNKSLVIGYDDTVIPVEVDLEALASEH